MDGINLDPEFKFPYRFSDDALKQGINQRRVRECVQSDYSQWHDIGRRKADFLNTIIGFSNDDFPIKTRICFKFGLGFADKDIIEVIDAARPTQEELKRYWCR